MTIKLIEGSRYRGQTCEGACKAFKGLGAFPREGAGWAKVCNVCQGRHRVLENRQRTIARQGVIKIAPSAGIEIWQENGNFLIAQDKATVMLTYWQAKEALNAMQAFVAKGK